MRPSTNISRFEEQLGYWRTKYPTDFIYDNENRPTSLRYNGTAYAGGSGLAPAMPTAAEVLIPRFETMRDGTLLE